MKDHVDLEKLRAELEAERERVEREFEEYERRLEQIEALLSALTTRKRAKRRGGGVTKSDVRAWLKETDPNLSVEERSKAVQKLAKKSGKTGLNLVPRFLRELTTPEGGGGVPSSTRPPTVVVADK